METKDVILQLRSKNGLSQDELAGKVHVTRQAVSRWETGGTFNEEYCKWCYADGKFVYTSLEELTDFLVGHMANENWPPEQARSFFQAQLPKLNYWRQP